MLLNNEVRLAVMGFLLASGLQAGAAEKQWVEVSPGFFAGTADEALRKQEPSGYTRAVGDFDGDGQEDSARLLASAAGDGEFAVALALSSERQVPHIVSTGTEIARVGLATQAPGHYPTACGKGAGKADAPCTEAVTLAHPALALFTFESATRVLYIDNGQVREVWLAD
ncbi:hypothetical protein [Pseudomonas sp. TUM22785]|uniref:hypothetical protein n=1 Tax=Pseudomonas sp. TUM22785 TaxID=3019098 RepID=UPI00230519E6|nr:hypothetical protein [Pseudomonas sp. TUM22785]WCD82826.1 hypothetical protein PI990_12635 [Pseudomonas sp. TUM22785]